MVQRLGRTMYICVATGALALALLGLVSAVTPNTFIPTDHLFTARAGGTSTLLPNGQVLFAGGEGNGSTDTPLSSAELYDPTTGFFTVTGSMGAKRAGATATLLPNGLVLVAGGFNGTVLASAELDASV